MTTVHVLPINDLIEHEEEGDNCPCGPTVEPVKRADGSMGWLLVHHSLDGREQTQETAMNECPECGARIDFIEPELEPRRAGQVVGAFIGAAIIGGVLWVAVLAVIWLTKAVLG